MLEWWAGLHMQRALLMLPEGQRSSWFMGTSFHQKEVQLVSAVFQCGWPKWLVQVLIGHFKVIIVKNQEKGYKSLCFKELTAWGKKQLLDAYVKL